jgi:hypothetical protein
MHESGGEEDVDYGQGVGYYAEFCQFQGFFLNFFKRAAREETNFRIKLYASPGGGASMMITDTSQCSNRPMNGALRGLLLAHNFEKGRIPSRPTS